MTILIFVFTMSDLSVIPLRLGRLEAIDFGLEKPGAHGTAYVKKKYVALMAYAITGGNEKILVDTGPPDQNMFEEFDNRRYEQTEDEVLENALQKLAGWSPDDVDIVVNTHLHCDHCWNNELFTNAKVYIQRRELRQAAAPLPSEKRMYYMFMGKASYTRTDTQIIDGDFPLADGVTLLLTPGHTWGLQSVMVECAGKKVLIASDNVADMRIWETGLHAPLTSFPCEWYGSIARLKAMKPDFVLSGHDMRVFDKEQYP